MAQWDDEDWFRSSTWNDVKAAEFETRLKRARSYNRAQYCRIQAGHLTAQSDQRLHDIGRRLFQRVIEDFAETDPGQARAASEQLAASWAGDGQLAEAEREYRRTLELLGPGRSDRNFTTGVTELSLAEVLYQQAGEPRLHEALALLDDAETESTKLGLIFPIAEYRFLLAKARVLAALRDPASAEVARRALDVAIESEPTARRHSDVRLPKSRQPEQIELASIRDGTFIRPR